MASDLKKSSKQISWIFYVTFTVHSTADQSCQCLGVFNLKKGDGSAKNENSGGGQKFTKVGYQRRCRITDPPPIFLNGISLSFLRPDAFPF